jgi:hypothetical protein
MHSVTMYVQTNICREFQISVCWVIFYWLSLDVSRPPMKYEFIDLYICNLSYGTCEYIEYTLLVSMYDSFLVL